MFPWKTVQKRMARDVDTTCSSWSTMEFWTRVTEEISVLIRNKFVQARFRCHILVVSTAERYRVFSYTDMIRFFWQHSNEKS